jgi:hypothetical protein
MPNSTDGKRQHPRKIAAWPAWVKFHRSARYLKGRTRDVSRGGAYVLLPLDDAPAPGEPVEYILGVRREQDGQFVIQSVSGEAVIVRVEDGLGGIALRFAGERDI